MKLLICEDDISTIDVLKNNIDFIKYGIDNVLEAYNGEMAIEIIKQNNPELIISDIGMPKKNGIEVLKFARKNNPQVQFSLLTCYEDFDYAQKAIEYNVASYVTKPFKLKEVENALTKMVSQYKKSTSNDQTQTKLDLLYSSVYKQVSDGVFGTDKSLIASFLEGSGTTIDVDDKYHVVFSCLNINETINDIWNKDLILSTSAKIHDEALLDYVGSAHSIVNNDDRFLWCMSFIPGGISKKQIEKRIDKLMDFYEEHFSIKPVVLISDEFIFYETANIVTKLYAMIRKIRFYSGKVFHELDEIQEVENNNILNNNQLLWYLKNRDEVGYEEYIHSLLNKIEINEELVKFKDEIKTFYLVIFKDNNIPDSIIYEDNNVNILEKKTCTKKSILDYAKLLMSIYQKQADTINDSKNIILRAKKFVDENYRENIDRDDVAEIAFVTPNYLSKLFRNNIGMNLREYINQLRIEEAKRLLLSTPMSISEIASYVGYYNISYFSTVFHKLVGVSPVDWRNNKQEVE